MPELADVNSDAAAKGLETALTFDRATAARLGVTTQAIDSVLNDAFSQRNASTIYTALNQYLRDHGSGAGVSAESGVAQGHLRAEASSGRMVPLTAFASYAFGTTPLAVNHHGQFVSTTISFNLADGVSLGQASDAITQTMSRLGVPASDSRRIRRQCERVPEGAKQPAVADPCGAADDLHRARRAVRELRASADDTFDPALGRRRRDHRAARVPHAVHRHRLHRRDPADRHRQEERDHDDRLRAGCRTQPRPERARCGVRSLPAALSTDHDDDDGGDARRIAAGDRLRRGQRDAPTARHFDSRRPAGQPVADACTPRRSCICTSTVFACGASASGCAFIARRRARRRRRSCKCGQKVYK